MRIIKRMSTQFHSALQSILAMPYFKNEHARSGGAVFGHEEAVAEKIKAAGFTEVDKKQYPKLTKGLLKKWANSGNDVDLRKATEGLPEGTYILQPAGTQGFPDVLVKDWGDRFVSVECKSGMNGLCPMWNDNIPKPNSVYVLSSGIRNETTVFMGKDVISPEEQQLMDEQEAAIAKLVKEYNDKTKIDWLVGADFLRKMKRVHMYFISPTSQTTTTAVSSNIYDDDE